MPHRGNSSSFSEILLHDGHRIQCFTNAALVLENIKQEAENYERSLSVFGHGEDQFGFVSVHSLKAIKHEDESFTVKMLEIQPLLYLHPYLILLFKVLEADLIMIWCPRIVGFIKQD